MANKIHKTAIIGPNVHLGDNVEIGPYCIIGMPGEHRDMWRKSDYGVYIGSGCILTGAVTIDSGVSGITYLYGDAFIMKHAHIGHDATIGRGVTISCGAKVGGHTVIDDYANIGLNVVIHQNHRVEEWVMIGMGAVLPAGVKTERGHTYVGNPARCIGVNKKAPVEATLLRTNPKRPEPRFRFDTNK